jgi:polysaccharide biosynthesis protein PslL
VRNITVDIVKGLGILSVILCHNWILFHNRGELSNIVFSVHMPLFVFLSGLFFRPTHTIDHVISSKFSSLLKPFFVVLLLNYFFHVVTNPHYPYKLELLNIVYASGGTVSWTPLWFLSHIFIVFIAAWCLHYYVLRKLTHNVYKWVLLLLIFWVGASNIGMFADNQLTDALFSSQTQLVRGLPFNLDIILVTLPIFLAGHLLSDSCLTFKPQWLIVTLMLIVFITLHYLFDETLELNGRQFGNFIVCTAQIISGTYLIFTLGFLLQFVAMVSKVLQYLGGATLYLLIFHFVPQHIVTGSLQFHFPEYLLTCAIIGMLTSILFSLALWEITSRVPVLKRLMLPIANIKK